MTTPPGTPHVGYTIAFGVSDNDGRWWDDRHASFLGYRPKDSARQFADRLPERVAYPPADDITTLYQGGAFLEQGRSIGRKAPGNAPRPDALSWRTHKETA